MNPFTRIFDRSRQAAADFTRVVFDEFRRDEDSNGQRSAAPPAGK